MPPTRFIPWQSLVIVRARVWGPLEHQSVHLAVDTGAVFSAISESVLRRIGINRGDSVGMFDVITASRAERWPAYDVRLAALGAEPRIVRIVGHSLPIGIPVQGLLGLDFLQDRRLTIDFRQRTIELV